MRKKKNRKYCIGLNPLIAIILVSYLIQEKDRFFAPFPFFNDLNFSPGIVSLFCIIPTKIRSSKLAKLELKLLNKVKITNCTDKTGRCC